MRETCQCLGEEHRQGEEPVMAVGVSGGGGGRGGEVGVPRGHQIGQYAWERAQVMGCRDARTISYRVAGH